MNLSVCPPSMVCRSARHLKLLHKQACRTLKRPRKVDCGSVIVHCTCAQISGGHKYLPPKQDVNAPDLYIPTMAVGTYCLIVCFASAAAAKFKPEVMTSAVRHFGAQRGSCAGASGHRRGFRLQRGAPIESTAKEFISRS